MWSIAYLYELRTTCMEFSRKRTEDEHSVILDLIHQKQKWYFKVLTKINQPRLVFFFFLILCCFFFQILCGQFTSFYSFIYLFLAVLGLRLCARAFSSCGKREPLFIAVRGPLTIAASPAAEHRLQTHRLSNCGSRAQPLRSMWDPPRPGLEPVSPALAGRPSTTAPPGKP